MAVHAIVPTWNTADVKTAIASVRATRIGHIRFIGFSMSSTEAIANTLFAFAAGRLGD